ncbi:MAG: RNB domain-containing ribonuclease, partial [Bacteroidota bacterium]
MREFWSSCRKSRGRKPDGKVIRVLKRNADRFLGSVHIFRKYAIVIPDNKFVPIDINVAFNDLKGAEDGDKVVVEIINWKGGKGKMPQGRITTVLGAEGSSDIAMKGILINQGFDIEFPEKVLRETENMKLTINEKELSRRRDFRDIWTITIDPETAKDFDDALSLEYLENGQYEIGVHIADVTHYVKPGTALDKEAYRRSTSVYLVDRVAPMLPEKLSNGLCSLVPNEDRFTYSASFTFDKSGNIIKKWFGKSIIHSDRRFTYEEAQEVLDGQRKEFVKELKKLNTVAKKLRKAKFKNGAINFDSEEVKFKLDEEGTPIGVYVKERKDAHLLVEDFMLLANKEVAAFMSRKDNGRVPFVYRIHDIPDPDKVEDFVKFAKVMGIKMQTG